MHVCTINHWEAVIEELTSLIRTSGLIDVTEKIFIGTVGPKHADDIIEKSQEIYYNPDITVAELMTIDYLHKFCIKNPHIYVWYIHTKGVGRPHISQESWRQYMSYFVIERYEDCIEALGNCDACGVDYTLPNSIVHNDHFAGNFWWANGDYVATLPPICTNGSRWSAETFIGGKSPCIINFHTSHMRYYQDCYPRKRYADTKSIKSIKIKEI